MEKMFNKKLSKKGDLSSPVVWLLMVALMIAVSHALCAISRRCERVLGRRSKGNTLNCDWAAYSGCTSSANMYP